MSNLKWVKGTPEAEDFCKSIRHLRSGELRALRKDLENRRHEAEIDQNFATKWEMGMKIEFILDELYRRGHD
jgi:hypothetical protein